MGPAMNPSRDIDMYRTVADILLIPVFRACRQPTEADLVAVRVSIGHLPNPVRVGLALGGFDPSAGDLADHCIEVIDDDRVHRVTGVLRSLFDEH